MSTLVKPGVDAYRVETEKSSRNMKEVGVAVNYRMIMTMQKAIELVFESTPGKVIQMMAFFATEGDRSVTPAWP